MTNNQSGADALAGARVKLEEATYFLRLMDRLERQQVPFVEGNDFKQEYSFQLSAFLNACYSVVVYLRDSTLPIKDLARAFYRKHEEMYGHGTGHRSRAVHIQPVEPGHLGYIPPPGNNVILRWSAEDPPYKLPRKTLDFHIDDRGRFYFDGQGPRNCIGNLCAVHLGDLRKLVKACDGP